MKNTEIYFALLKKSENVDEQKMRTRFTNRYNLIALILLIIIIICGIIDHVHAGHLFDVVTKCGAAIVFLWVFLMYLIPFKTRAR